MLDALYIAEAVPVGSGVPGKIYKLLKKIDIIIISALTSGWLGQAPSQMPYRFR
ncbi:hypothetical protein [Novosphingobium sp. Rr 2-17]|uniref:hypothetical protein n=1 Tax=Novosphingobium sp. Rr 2-17 TaxID=555793 RepID=UPI0012F629C9|nr:hypothetical protein [Novosphingobium sp. Rr 2-17]